MHRLIKTAHPQWHPLLEQALTQVAPAYLTTLEQRTDWLPGLERLFAAFSQPLENVRYILLGESPYPRARSANGYAFWDGAVQNVWSTNGLSKEVNRATSLRNFVKMLLVARGDLNHDQSQMAIARLNKASYWQTADELFSSLLHKGFLLLNASLVYDDAPVRFHAKHWQPFMTSLFRQLLDNKPVPQLLLFGRIAAQIPEAQLFTCLIAEHPYNLSFIANPDVLAFFKPLDLLSCHDK